MENIFEKVVKVLAENLGCEVSDVHLQAHIVDDLGADSLDLVELAMALEEEFGITVADGDFESLQTVAQIIAYVESK